jgi:hypothetical protein
MLSTSRTTCILSMCRLLAFYTGRFKVSYACLLYFFSFSYETKYLIIFYFVLFYQLKVVFITSIIQFSFAIAATKQRNLKAIGFAKFLDLIFATEAWSLIMLLISQDLPCFIIRVLILNSVDEANYSLMFFTVKNGMMIFLELIRVYLAIRKQLKLEASILSPSPS